MLYKSLRNLSHTQCFYSEHHKLYHPKWSGWDYFLPTKRQEIKSGDVFYTLHEIDENNFIVLHLESMNVIMMHALYLEKI